MKLIYIFAIVFLVSLCNCGGNPQPIVQEAHIDLYLNPKTDINEVLLSEIEFWDKKITNNKRGYTYYQKAADASQLLFDETADTGYLSKARDYYLSADSILEGHRKAMNKLLIAQLEMKLHNFSDASKYAVDSGDLTDETFAPLLIQYDAEMELGNHMLAKSSLDKAKKNDSFDYLVRLSKYKDFEGDLDSAIYYMEKAKRIAANQSNKVWVNSVLGDMYGHNGQIEESYSYYLKTLELKGNEHHSLKGIAWIALSADENYPLALKIVDYLVKTYPNPEYRLLMADINELMLKESEAKSFRDEFLVLAKNPIYNSYTIPLLANEEPKKALHLALDEVNRRPTVSAFGLLSWSYFMNGEIGKAIEICEKEVYGRTSEPLDIYRMALIYKKAGERKKAREMYKKVFQAQFELGPLKIKKIRFS